MDFFMTFQAQRSRPAKPCGSFFEAMECPSQAGQVMDDDDIFIYRFHCDGNGG